MQNANNAEQSQDTPSVRKPTIVKRIKKPKGQKYTIAEQETLLRFLAAYSIQADTALSSVKAMADGQPNNHPAHGMVRYWTHVLSAIKWLADRVPLEQSHLNSLSEEQLTEARKQWTQAIRN